MTLHLSDSLQVYERRKSVDMKPAAWERSFKRNDLTHLHLRAHVLDHIMIQSVIGFHPGELVYPSVIIRLESDVSLDHEASAILCFKGAR